MRRAKNSRSRRLTKQDVRIRITFSPDGYTELEVSTPIHSQAGLRMWAALASLRINPTSAYLVRSEKRLIANVKLTEYDGSPLGQSGAGEVLNALKERLSSPGASGGMTQSASGIPIPLVHCAERSSADAGADELRSAS